MPLHYSIGRKQRRNARAGIRRLHIFRQIDHKGIEIAERGAKDELRSVEVDHRLHGFRAGVGLRDVLFLDDFDAGNLL